MSLLEKAPQKQKGYDGRKQDHGDAASQRGHFGSDYYAEYQEGNFAKNDAAQLKDALQDTEQLDGLSPEELEAAANILLDEEPLLSYSSEKPGGEVIDDDVDDVRGTQDDRFPTEADFGLKSKREVRNAMARRVTLDVHEDDDDTDGDEFAVPVRIKNRL